MSTTGMVMTVTDELLAELEEAAKGASHWNLDACFQVVEEGYLPDEWYWHIGHCDEGNQYPVLLVDTDQYDAPPSDAKAVARHYANCGSRNIIALTAELRRLRAENAELERVVKDVRWRVADTTDQLQAYGHNGDRLYGLDEWSVPIRNLNIAIGILDKATQ